MMKNLALLLVVLCSLQLVAQTQNKKEEQLQKKANNYVYEANTLVEDNKYIAAEMEYRKAISTQPYYTTGNYNLGTSYYKKGNYNEALYRLQQSLKKATIKEEKHKIYHNIGNILMQEKECIKAVEAYKNALRNNPKDEETRYNFALAKQCAEQQQEQQDQNDKNDNKDQQENKDNKENQDKKPEEEGEQDKKEGDKNKDEEGKPKDEENKDQDKGGEPGNNQQKKQPKPGQLSAQQAKNLLEAMDNQEQKVQEKMNLQKQKGVRVQTEKDW